MNYKKHDRVYFFFTCGGLKKIYGYVQKKIRELYVIIDDAGREWFMYPEELRPAQTYIKKELTTCLMNHKS